MTTEDRHVKKIARTLVNLERRVRFVETKPQLAFSSIDDGTLGLTNGGTPTGSIGVLPDGTTGVIIVNQPGPPKPNPPTLTPVNGGMLIRYDGTFSGDAFLPMNWTRTEVYVSTDAGFDPGPFDVFVTTIESPRGGEVFIPITDTDMRYVRLIARNTAGSPSAASDVVFASLTAIQAASAAAALVAANGKNKNYYQDVKPTGGSYAVGDNWYEPSQGYRRSAWDGTQWVLGKLNYQAIEQLDIGIATFGALNGNRIKANSADIDVLKTSTLTSKTITLGSSGIIALATGGKIIVGNTSSGWTADHLGFRLYSGGEQMADFPVTGNPTLKGHLTALSLALAGGATISGNADIAGVLTVVGRIRTSVFGRRIEMGGATEDGAGYMRFHNSWSVDSGTGPAPAVVWNDDAYVLNLQAGYDATNPSRLAIGPEIKFFTPSGVMPLKVSDNRLDVIGELSSASAYSLRWRRSTISAGAVDAPVEVTNMDSYNNNRASTDSTMMGFVRSGIASTLALDEFGNFVFHDGGQGYVDLVARSLYAQNNGVQYGSSETIKSKIVPLDVDLDVLSVVEAVVPIQFEYTENPGVQQIGFRAEDLMPYGLARHYEGNGPLVVDPMHQVAVLWCAVRELKQKLDAHVALAVPTL